MTTITVWLLISIGYNGSNAGYAQPTLVVERFATVQECQRVAKVIVDSSYGGARLQCVQATVAR